MGLCHSSSSVSVSDPAVVHVKEDTGGGGMSPSGAVDEEATTSSSSSSLSSKQGKKKGPNQDSAILFEGYGGYDGTLCGVFDGHGRSGHLVSRLVRDRLPHLLLSQRDAVFFPPQHADTDDNDEEAHGCDDDDQYDGDSSPSSDSDSDDEDDQGNDRCSSPEMFQSWKEACVGAFRAMDKELKNCTGFDCSYSGTTAVTVIKQGKDMVIANLGDSRAVLGTLNEQGDLTAVQLTTDLKPNLPHEAERIKKSNGRVFALRDEPSISRVWLPNENYPGLAMARAFGDIQLKRYGVIATPQVSYRKVHPRDQFIVLATDGVWDVLTNDEVVSIVWVARTREEASSAVVAAAVRAWKKKYPNSKPDDCTAVCLSLQDEYDQGEEETDEYAHHR